ncbi:hypothetical protein ACTU44_21860 (plasmid) [Thalassospira sp. SM2505]
MPKKTIAVIASLMTLAACTGPREAAVGVGNGRNQYKVSPCATSFAESDNRYWSIQRVGCKSLPLEKTNFDDWLNEA